MTLERIAELVNGKTDKTIVFGVRINEDYFINVMKVTYYRNNKANNCFKMTLVKDAKTGNGLDNKIIAQETIGMNASDRVVMNRYNKLVGMVK